MDKNVKRILWGTGILVTLAIVLTIYSCISGNYAVGGYFAVGVIVALFGFCFIGSIIYYLIGFIKQHSKEKNVYKEKIEKKKPLPLYSRNIILSCILFYIVISLIFYFGLRTTIFQGNSDTFDYYFWFYVVMSLIGAIIFYIKLRQAKMLYLIKDNEKIIRYEDNVDDSPDLFMIQRCLGARGSFIKKKCECIELNNNIQIFSCFSKEITHYSSNDGYSTRYFSFIIATESYENTNNFIIEINNSPSAYLNKENQYISKYSNLPPLLVTGENVEDICRNIEEVCSDFFSKIRARYVLIIRDGTISLGLNSARFGRINRLFNKSKTAELTKEAIEEMANFLLKIKRIIER